MGLAFKQAELFLTKFDESTSPKPILISPRLRSDSQPYLFRAPVLNHALVRDAALSFLARARLQVEEAGQARFSKREVSMVTCGDLFTLMLTSRAEVGRQHRTGGVLHAFRGWVRG